MAQYLKDKPKDFTLSPTKQRYNWEAIVYGPTGTPYEGGSFRIEMKIPADYPFKPPALCVMTRIYHLNINNAGRISHDFLCECMGNWSPAFTLARCT